MKSTLHLRYTGCFSLAHAYCMVSQFTIHGIRFRNRIHPVLLQYLSGTLDNDPREDMLQVEL